MRKTLLVAVTTGAIAIFSVAAAGAAERTTATDELERHLGTLGVERRSTLFIGTVHGFALTRIILPFARVGGHPETADPKIASDSGWFRWTSGKTSAQEPSRFVQELGRA